MAKYFKKYNKYLKYKLYSLLSLFSSKFIEKKRKYESQILFSLIKFYSKYNNEPLENIHKFVCKPQSFKNNELWWWNNFYGINYILKKYANIDLKKPLKCVVGHGVNFQTNNKISPEELKVNLPFILLTNNFVSNAIEKEYNKKCYPISLHILYAPDYYDKNKFEKEKQKLGKNLLVFPVHSCEWVSIKYSVKAFIDEILKIKNEHNFNSVTICLHYLDVFNNLDKEYEGYGFNIVSAGYILDINFFSRLKTIIKLSDMAMANEVGSSLFNTIGLNKPFYLYIDKSITSKNTTPQFNDNYQEGWYENVYLKDKNIQDIHKAFSIYSETLTPDQLKLREAVCDLKEFKTPKQIKELLEKSEKEYKEKSYIKEIVKSRPTL